MGLLDGLAKFGLNNLNSDDMYAENTKPEKKAAPEAEKKEVVLDERDFIFPKKYECPICDSPIEALTMKSGKARMISMDRDLRPVYEGVEPIKYEPVVCQCCGYAVMGRYFGNLTPTQRKWVMEAISKAYTGNVTKRDIITFDEALENITLALASAIYKKSKASEKAYICLKGGWLCRSYKEALDKRDPDYDDKCKELSEKEKEFMDNAYEGFVQARMSENYPMAGMDETTVDYLLAVMACDRGELDVASKMVATILGSASVSNRIKDKTRDLKEELVQKIKEKKATGK